MENMLICHAIVVAVFIYLNFFYSSTNRTATHWSQLVYVCSGVYLGSYVVVI